MMRLLSKVTATSDWLAGWVILASMLLVAGNVVVRAFPATTPIEGTYEWTGFLTAVAVSLALANCAYHGGHTVITLLVDYFPARLKKLDRVLVHLLTAAFLAMAAWRLAVLATDTWQSGEVASTTKIPIHPFIYITAAGVTLYAVVELAKMVHLIMTRPAELEEEEEYLAFAPHDSCPLPAPQEQEAASPAPGSRPVPQPKGEEPAI
jgi:TRAP-type C4-dicarboxylate transport system permease small subunit